MKVSTNLGNPACSIKERMGVRLRTLSHADTPAAFLYLYCFSQPSSFACKNSCAVKPRSPSALRHRYPSFTAGVYQDWVYGADGQPLYWPIDNSFLPGERVTNFLGCEVRKQYHTLTQILMGLLRAGFVLDAVEEAEPPADMMDLPGMKDELRRPMMLLVKATAVKEV